MTIMSDLGQEELVTNFFRHMTQLTCHFADKASQQDSVNTRTLSANSRSSLRKSLFV